MMFLTLPGKGITPQIFTLKFPVYTSGPKQILKSVMSSTMDSALEKKNARSSLPSNPLGGFVSIDDGGDRSGGYHTHISFNGPTIVNIGNKADGGVVLVAGIVVIAVATALWYFVSRRQERVNHN